MVISGAAILTVGHQEKRRNDLNGPNVTRVFGDPKLCLAQETNQKTEPIITHNRTYRHHCPMYLRIVMSGLRAAEIGASDYTSN
jgi:hypothetical protein